MNEARHIARSLSSLRQITKNVLVLDSGSTDGTQEIAVEHGAHVRFRKFDDFAGQRNAALELLNELFAPDIVVCLDADEYLNAEAVRSIREWIRHRSSDVLLLRLQVVFEGRVLRWGNRRCTVLPRVFPANLRIERREVNEHLATPPGTKFEVSRGFLVHDDSLSWAALARKHVTYAEREAVISTQRSPRVRRPPRERHLRNRWLRESVYSFLPFRPALAFVYQYILKLGVLDGRPGFDRALLDAFTEYSIVQIEREADPRWIVEVK